MDIETFLETERSFHNNYAKKLNWNESVSESMSYRSPVPVEKYVNQLLGNVEGKRILDIGSGHGNCALNLAKRGAIVTSIDISTELIAGCKQRAITNGLHVDFRVMNACELDFDDETFDFVVSFVAIHHMPDLRQFYLEAHRVLKREGTIILIEPKKYNFFIEFVRKYIRNKETYWTPTEHLFVRDDIRLFKNIFGNMKKREFAFLSVSSLFFKRIINLPLAYNVSLRLLTFADDILRHIPGLRSLYWGVVLQAVKK